MKEPIEQANSNPFETVWVFLAELNTSPDVGCFKEIICDRSLNGEPLPENMVVLGAMNPCRKRRQTRLKEERNSELENALAKLVYRVFPLPPTLKVCTFKVKGF